MFSIINDYVVGDMRLVYVLNTHNRAVMTVLPLNVSCEILNKKNREAYNDASLVHLHLTEHNVGILSNSFKFGESLEKLQYKEQKVIENDEGIEIITLEEAEEGYAVEHKVFWKYGESGFEVTTTFINNSDKTFTLEYLSSASLDALSPCLPDEGSDKLLFHRFKAGWSMEGLHQQNTLTELGLERAWARSAESIKLSAIGSRPVREYHPYLALEDVENGVIWGMYLAHPSSWQMELTRFLDGVSLSVGLADSMTGLWSKKIAAGESFVSPKAMVSVAQGSIAEISNRILSMRHCEIDKVCGSDMGIIYNDFVTTWGEPTQERLQKTANILKNGKTKYFVMDYGWFLPKNAVGDWGVDEKAFPDGMKNYTDSIRALGMVPGLWMEFECVEKGSEAFKAEYDSLKLKYNDKVILGTVINGREEQFLDFRKSEVIERLDTKVIEFLRDNGVGYLKIDYNVSIGVGIDGTESPGENLREHMECVREYIKKIKANVPGIVVENCASGGCRLEPSMMDITDMSSASDTHEGYEGAVVAANLHYLTPPRQNQIWCTLKPDYTEQRFTFVISQGFLGRICWSGLIDELTDAQLERMFAAEKFYEEVSDIIMHGNSYIYRTNTCSFYSPKGRQAVVRYSTDYSRALVVTHSFEDTKELTVELKGRYQIEKTLYDSEAEIFEEDLVFYKGTALSGNVYLLKKTSDIS